MLLLANAVGQSTALGNALFLGNKILPLLGEEFALMPTLNLSVSRYSCSLWLLSSIAVFFLMIAFVLSCRCWFMLFHIHSLFNNVCFLSG